MTDRHALELECQLRFIELVDFKPQDEPPSGPLDMFIDGFWAGIEAAASPRSAEVLRNALELRRRAAGIIR